MDKTKDWKIDYVASEDGPLIYIGKYPVIQIHHDDIGKRKAKACANHIIDLHNACAGQDLNVVKEAGAMYEVINKFLYSQNKKTDKDCLRICVLWRKSTTA
jgi:hypothetical protein